MASSSGTSFTYNDTTTGLGTVTSTGTVNTPILLGGLMATVPSAAYYKSKDLLSFSSVSLSAGGSSVPAVGANALHLVAFLADVTGAGSVASSDVLAMEQVLAGVSYGFAPYPLADPNIVGDIAGQGALNGFDVALLTGSINLVVTPQMPVYPGAPHNTLTGPDPTVSIPSTLQLGSDGSVTVPVNIDDPHPAGSTGMTQATLALTYDPAVLSVSASDIQLGSVPASGTGWTLQAAVDPAAGQIGVTLWSPTPISSSAAGSLVTIVFHRTDAAATGTTAIDLVPSVDPAGSGVIVTQVDDDLGPYTLTPAPTDGFDPQIDGLLSLGGGGTDAAAVLPQLATSVVAGPVAGVGVRRRRRSAFRCVPAAGGCPGDAARGGRAVCRPGPRCGGCSRAGDPGGGGAIRGPDVGLADECGRLVPGQSRQSPLRGRGLELAEWSARLALIAALHVAVVTRLDRISA